MKELISISQFKYLEVFMVFSSSSLLINALSEEAHIFHMQFTNSSTYSLKNYMENKVE